MSTPARRVAVAAGLVALLVAAVALSFAFPSRVSAAPGQPCEAPPCDTTTTASEPATTAPPQTTPTTRPAPVTTATPPPSYTDTTVLVASGDAVPTTSYTPVDDETDDEQAAPAVVDRTGMTFTTVVNLLVPGNGIEGAQVTTTTETPTDSGSTADDESRMIWMIIAALAAVGLLVAVLTWRYWLLTRPGLDLDEGVDGEPDEEDGRERGGRRSARGRPAGVDPESPTAVGVAPAGGGRRRGPGGGKGGRPGQQRGSGESAAGAGGAGRGDAPPGARGEGRGRSPRGADAPGSPDRPTSRSGAPRHGAGSGGSGSPPAVGPDGRPGRRGDGRPPNRGAPPRRGGPPPGRDDRPDDRGRPDPW